MIDFLRQYLGSIICGLGVLAIIVLIILNGIRDKKKGKSSCGCNCSSCPMSGHCHEDKVRQK